MHAILLPSSRFVRLRETLKHPDQAAIAARLPLVGERVPMRSFWSRRPVRPARVLRHGAASAAQAISHATDLVRPADIQEALLTATPSARAAAERAVHSVQHTAPVARAAADRAAQTLEQAAPQVRAVAAHAAHTVQHAAAPVRRAAHDIDERLNWKRMRMPLPYVVGTMAALAALMYFIDPQSGRRRRARVRDRFSRTQRIVSRDIPRKVEKRGRFFQGVVTGIQHNAGELIHREQMPPPDNETLVARVRSQVLRDGELKAGEINIEAYEGCVTLRGQLDDDSAIRHIVSATRHVSGVREVRNYLHTPGADPPNKHDSLNGQSEAAPSRHGT